MRLSKNEITDSSVDILAGMIKECGWNVEVKDRWFGFGKKITITGDGQSPSNVFRMTPKPPPVKSAIKKKSVLPMNA